MDFLFVRISLPISLESLSPTLTSTGLVSRSWYLRGERESFNDAALTGIPTAPTASTGTNTTQIATTEFVQQNSGLKVGDILTTTRTDLGDKYLLCNGDAVSETEYPELCELLVNQQFSETAPYNVLCTATVTNTGKITKVEYDDLIGMFQV